VSPDGKLIISCGEDGSIFVMSLKETDSEGNPVNVIDENYN